MSQTQVLVRNALHQGQNVLRLGLVGCGERAVALPPAIARTNNTRLVMAMDVNSARVQEFGRRFDVPWTASLEEILSSRLVDAVIICTPHSLHASQAIQAARLGKHVIVEKPLATSFGDASAVVQAAHDAGVRLSVFLSHRYQFQIQQAKALIRSGALGELFGVSLMVQRDRFSRLWQGEAAGQATSNWRMRRESSGGGMLITAVIHYLDWLRYVPGLEVTEVSAIHATLDSPGDVEDTISLWLRYENGAVGTMNASACARGTSRTGDLLEFRLWGRDGHISLTAPYQFYSLRFVDGKRPGLWHALSGIRDRGPDVQFIQRFADLVLRGEQPEITGEDGLAVQAIVEAAYRSAESRRSVRIHRGPWRLEESRG